MKRSTRTEYIFTLSLYELRIKKLKEALNYEKHYLDYDIYYWNYNKPICH